MLFGHCRVSVVQQRARQMRSAARVLGGGRGGRGPKQMGADAHPYRCQGSPGNCLLGSGIRQSPAIVRRQPQGASYIFGVGEDRPMRCKIAVNRRRQKGRYRPFIWAAFFCLGGCKHNPPRTVGLHQSAADFEGSKILQAHGTNRQECNHQPVAELSRPPQGRIRCVAASASAINVMPASTSTSV